MTVRSPFQGKASGPDDAHQLTDQDVVDAMRGDSRLNRARIEFCAASARIEQASQQRRPPSPIEIRRMEYEAVRLIARAMGVEHVLRQPEAPGPGDMPLQERRADQLTFRELGDAAAQAFGQAADEALAAGLPVTGSKDGRIVRRHPDGQEEDLGPVHPHPPGT